MTKKERKPRGFWTALRDQLEADARTMTHAQMAEKYDTTAVTMATCLRSMGIRRGLLYPGIEEMAKTMTAPELAEHFGISIKRVRATLDLRGVKCLRMHVAFGSGAHKDEITRLTLTLTKTELARHFGISYRSMGKALQELGIQAAARAIKAQACKLPKASPKRLKSRPKAQAASRPSVAFTPKPPPPPPKIIMPDGVKITVSQLDTSGMRLCNGTSTQVYNPAQHGGVMRSPR